MNVQSQSASLPSSNGDVSRLLAAMGRAVLAVGLVWCHSLAAANFTASLDRDTVALGESTTLSLVFDGGEPTQVPEIPSIANLSITYLGPTSKYVFVNGRSSSTLTHNYLIRASKPGDYTIPALTATVDGKPLTTSPVTLKVLKSGDAVPNADLVGQNAFLRLFTQKTNVFLGEILPVDIRLYARQGRLKQAPQLTQEGFTVGKLVQQPETRALVGNQYYSVVQYKSYVAAAKTGTLKLGPATMLFAMPHPQSRVNLFGEPMDWIDANLSSDPIPIEVLPLPAANVPPDFNGAVGNFTLTATVSTNVVAVGDPITVTVRIAGRGVFEALALSCIEKWREFKTYPPVTRVETTDQLGIQGAKTFEQVVIPDNVEIKELPPITFSFFDPDQKAYRTVSHPATPISVRPGATTQAQPTIVVAPTQNPPSPPTATDIVHIKERAGEIGQLSPPLIRRPFFLAIQGLPLLLWLVALMWRQRQDQLANNPRLRRKHKVTATVRRGLAELRQQAAANESEQFYATVFRLLQQQLGERLDMPASAITEAVIEERLRPRGLAPETLESVHRLFQTCNQARYAPQSSGEQLASLVPQVEEALRQIRNLKD